MGPQSLGTGRGGQAGSSPWSRDRCGLYQNLEVSCTNLTLLWLSCIEDSKTGREQALLGSSPKSSHVSFSMFSQSLCTWELRGVLRKQRREGHVVTGASAQW